MTNKNKKPNPVLDNLELILAVLAVLVAFFWNLLGTVPNITLPFTVATDLVLLLTVTLLSVGILRQNYVQSVLIPGKLFDKLNELETELKSIPVDGVMAMPLQTSPRDWLDGECDKIHDDDYDSYEILVLQTFFADKDLIGETAKTALKRGAWMRILLAKPESAVAKIRSYDLYNDQSFAITSGIPKLDEFLGSLGQNELMRVEVRYYETIPPFSMYSVGNLILAGRYWYKKSTGEGYTELIRKDSLYGTQVINAFNQLWKESTTNSKSTQQFSKYPFLLK